MGSFLSSPAVHVTHDRAWEMLKPNKAVTRVATDIAGLQCVVACAVSPVHLQCQVLVRDVDAEGRVSVMVGRHDAAEVAVSALGFNYLVPPPSTLHGSIARADWTMVDATQGRTRVSFPQPLAAPPVSVLVTLWSARGWQLSHVVCAVDETGFDVVAGRFDERTADALGKGIGLYWLAVTALPADRLHQFDAGFVAPGSLPWRESTDCQAFVSHAFAPAWDERPVVLVTPVCTGPPQQFTTVLCATAAGMDVQVGCYDKEHFDALDRTRIGFYYVVCSKRHAPFACGSVLAPVLVEDAAVVRGEKLSEGSFGIVYAGTWRGNPVAIKELRNMSAAKEAEFLREALMFQSARSWLCVRLHAICRAPPMLVMEMMHHTLEEYIVARNDEPVPAATCLALGRQLVGALVHLHSCIPPIIHRDIKPNNLLMDEHNTQLKVADFGLARFTPVDPETPFLGSLMVPPLYEPPEMVHGDLYSARVDVWQMGLTMWNLAAGRMFVAVHPIIECTSKGHLDMTPVAPEVRPLIENCVVVDPNLRWNSARALEFFETLP